MVGGFFMNFLRALSIIPFLVIFGKFTTILLIKIMDIYKNGVMLRSC